MNEYEHTHKQYEIEATIVALSNAWRHAVAADLGQHFTSEIDHLIATARANRVEEGGRK